MGRQLSAAPGWLALTLAAGVVMAAVATPQHLPSIPSPMAHKSLLLDLARAGDRIVAVGEQGHIVYSDDDGSSWVHAQVPVSLMLTSVAFPTPRIGWAAGHEGIILNTTDGGESWQVQMDGQRIALLQIADAEREVARLQSALAQLSDEVAIEDAQVALEDAEFALEDAQALTETGIVTPILGLEFISATEGYAAGAYGLLLKTTDGGKQWSLISARINNPERYHYYDLASTASGALVLVGEAGVLYRSDDNGMQWQALSTGYQGSFFGVQATSDGGVLTYGLRGTLFRSSDDGQSWQAVTTASQATLVGGAVLPDGRILLSGAGGTLLLSANNGNSFTKIDSATRSTISAVTVNTAGKILVSGAGGVRVLDVPGSGR